MEQSIHAAQIDERTEIGDVLDLTFADLTDFHFLEQSGPAVFAGFFQQGPAGHHDILAFLIDLEDFQFIFLADELIHVLDRPDVNLGSRQKGFHAVQVDDDSALDAVFHQTGDDAAFTVFRGNLFPGADEIRFGQADFRHVAFIFDRFQIHVEGIADIHFFPIPEFRAGNKSFRLVTDIEESAVLTFFHDFARYD